MKKGLGKGIGELIKDTSAYDGEESAGVSEVEMYLIDTNADQPRKDFDEKKLRELAASVAAHGIMQPIIVAKQDGRYRIIAGERRYRAAKIAGLSTVPVIVRKLSKKDELEQSLIENIQREDLNAIEQARALEELIKKYSLTQDTIAKRVGKSRSAVANLLRLLTLPDHVKKYVEKGELSAGHARALLALKTPTEIADAAKLIIDGGLSVRQAETLVAQLLADEREQDRGLEPKKRTRAQSPEIADAMENLSRALETKVMISGSEKRGKVIIEYYSAEQLESLYDFLQTAGGEE